MTVSKLLRGFALSVLLAVFSYSAVKLITSTVSSYQEQHAFEELSAYVNTAFEPSRSITPFSASGQSDVQPSTNPTFGLHYTRSNSPRVRCRIRFCYPSRLRFSLSAIKGAEFGFLWVAVHSRNRRGLPGYVHSKRSTILSLQGF